MQADRDRDELVERLLRESMREPLTSPATPACLDGETIAAWAERTLPSAEAHTVERHLSECARCSSLLATFVRTAPEVAIPAPLWRRWHLPWLVPLATAAAAVAFWFAIPGNEPTPAQPQATEQFARLETPAAQPSQPLPSTAAPSALSGKLAKRVQPEDRREAKTEVQAPKESAGTLAREPNRKAEAAQEEPSRTLADRDAAAPQAAAERRDEGRANAAIPADKLAAAAPAPQPASVPAPPPATPASAALGETAGLRARAASQVVAALEILSPNPATRWRITAGRQVEHSTNGGSRWDAAPLPPSEALLAGFSPASSVCWIVGRGGTILVSSDGQRFTRVPFPEVVDLVSVRATNDQNATVTTTDGRVFSTSDRGTAWTRTQ